MMMMKRYAFGCMKQSETCFKCVNNNPDNNCRIHLRKASNKKMRSAINFVSLVAICFGASFSHGVMRVQVIGAHSEPQPAAPIVNEQLPAQFVSCPTCHQSVPVMQPVVQQPVQAMPPVVQHVEQPAAMQQIHAFPVMNAAAGMPQQHVGGSPMVLHVQRDLSKQGGRKCCGGCRGGKCCSRLSRCRRKLMGGRSCSSCSNLGLGGAGPSAKQIVKSRRLNKKLQRMKKRIYKQRLRQIRLKSRMEMARAFPANLP